MIYAGVDSKEHGSGSDIPASDKAWKSYLQQFLAKRSIKSRPTHGESADADSTAADAFMKNEWPGIFLSVDRDPSRVWNMDETGLFWRALLKRTLAKADERLSGGKTQKDRLTFATTVSMTGERLPLLGIGKSRLPRAVGAMKTTPASVLGGGWDNNPKAWMNETVFCKWLLEVEDQMMLRQLWVCYRRSCRITV